MKNRDFSIFRKECQYSCVDFSVFQNFLLIFHFECLFCHKKAFKRWKMFYSKNDQIFEIWFWFLIFSASYTIIIFEMLEILLFFKKISDFQNCVSFLILRLLYVIKNVRNIGDVFCFSKKGYNFITICFQFLILCISHTIKNVLNIEKFLYFEKKYQIFFFGFSILSIFYVNKSVLNIKKFSLKFSIEKKSNF